MRLLMKIASMNAPPNTASAVFTTGKLLDLINICDCNFVIAEQTQQRCPACHLKSYSINRIAAQIPLA